MREREAPTLKRERVIWICCARLVVSRLIKPPPSSAASQEEAAEAAGAARLLSGSPCAGSRASRRGPRRAGGRTANSAARVPGSGRSFKLSM